MAGVRDGHILDPTPGWPVPDAPRSITIVADTGVQAGMMSTLAILQGRKAEQFRAAQGLKFWCRRQSRIALKITSKNIFKLLINKELVDSLKVK
jgi:thiamine biosynthesis lipoprotein ApbE